ncbi:MAG TPA: hypothetical protein VMS12_12190 [Thermoanaerobaculia bacterium]|nr:hypothetical protein [Thermoanaerobaculia bacterium]
MSHDGDHVKVHIERAIERARHGVGEGIDELDRRVRDTMDIRRKAGEYAPQLMVAGAALGFVVGFGMPNLIKRTLQFGVPILIALKVAQAQSDAELAATVPLESLDPGRYS